ncbi:hypothetical protein BMW23_0314 [Bodo saltans virus]|uniref:Uncharacterized protein n=1 Tax=Bodo saltans virus TaxID=2024608 RepID=A0A2H4UTW2_9VIRU|nr:hypothetical protein QJ851_gp0309 [Bodo saltans virus]ATZ80372.1 hypothetical protein BMW23_0314 [Bodo saltans virus]
MRQKNKRHIYLQHHRDQYLILIIEIHLIQITILDGDMIVIIKCNEQKMQWYHLCIQCVQSDENRKNYAINIRACSAVMRSFGFVFSNFESKSQYKS